MILWTREHAQKTSVLLCLESVDGHDSAQDDDAKKTADGSPPKTLRSSKEGTPRARLDQQLRTSLKSLCLNKVSARTTSVYEKLAVNNESYLKVYDAIRHLLDNRFHGVNQNRKYYYVSMFKQVKVYEGFGSFGELALITNKHRKARIETIADTHFAILSKQDYKQVQGHVQKQILKEKV